MNDLSMSGPAASSRKNPVVLKNAMDWTFPEWQRKPIAFVGWGNVGGARVADDLTWWAAALAAARAHEQR